MGEALHAFLEDLEEDWERTKSELHINEIEDLEMFVIMEYCGGMIGEEVPLLSLKGVFFFRNKPVNTILPI